MLDKFVCFNLEAKFLLLTYENLESSNIFIMIMICNFLFDVINFCVKVSFLTKLLTLGILFSTAVRELVVAKLVILGISPLTSFILALRVVLVV